MDGGASFLQISIQNLMYFLGKVPTLQTIDPAPDSLADQELWTVACLFSIYEKRWAERMQVIPVTNAAYT